MSEGDLTTTTEAVADLWAGGLEWTAGSIVLRCDGQGVWHVYDTSRRSSGGWLGAASMPEHDPRKVGLWILRKAVGLNTEATHAFHNATRAITAGFHPPQVPVGL